MNDPRELHSDLEREYDRIFRPADPVDEAIKILVAEEKAKREAVKVRSDPDLSAAVDRRLAEIIASLDGKTAAAKENHE